MRRARNKGSPASGPRVRSRPRSVVTFQPHARKRSLQQPEIPVTRLDHDHHGHAAQDGELVHDGRGRRSSLGGTFGRGRLARHVDVRLQRRCHGWRSGANEAHGDGSGGSNRGTAPTAQCFHLTVTRQLSLTLLAPRVPDQRVVCTACAGSLFFCMSGATVPDALSECRHERSLSLVRPSADHETWRRTGCKRCAADSSETPHELCGARAPAQGIVLSCSDGRVAPVRI